MATARVYVPRMSHSHFLPLWEALQDQQIQVKNLKSFIAIWYAVPGGADAALREFISLVTEIKAWEVAAWFFLVMAACHS